MSGAEHAYGATRIIAASIFNSDMLLVLKAGGTVRNQMHLWYEVYRNCAVLHLISPRSWLVCLVLFMYAMPSVSTKRAYLPAAEKLGMVGNGCVPTHSLPVSSIVLDFRLVSLSAPSVSALGVPRSTHICAARSGTC